MEPPPSDPAGVSVPAQPPERYPMRYDVAYPRRLSRWKTFFRLFLFIPVWLFGQLVQYFAQIALLIGFGTVFWRRKYPGWLFSGLSGAFAFSARSSAYALLLTDRFPSFSPEDSPVTLEYDSPPSGHLSRWRVLFWKSVLLIPHIIVLSLVALAVFAVTLIAWFAILITGNYPRGMFQFVVGVQRWWWRIAGYFASFNDRFPPFALAADAGPASRTSTVANGVIGGVVAAGLATIIGIAVAAQANAYTVHLDYADVQSGARQPAYTFKVGLSDDTVRLRLNRAVDPGDELIQVIRPARNERVVVFQWTVENGSGSAQLIAGNAARLSYEYRGDRKSVAAVFIGVNNVAAPAKVRGLESATIQAAFVIPADADPVQLSFRGGFSRGGIRYVFD